MTLHPLRWFLPLALAAIAHADELRVAAAASLDEAMGEIAAAFEKETGIAVRPVIAGSNTLARQIEHGAPIDVFIAADERSMERLVGKKLVEKPQALLTNRLVVIIPKHSPAKIGRADDLLQLHRLAIGDPGGNPAGMYAKSWLERAGVWKSLQSRCVGTAHVRGALAAAGAGNVDAAIVYRTDAAISDKVRIAFEIPADESPEIRYPVAVCMRSTAPEEAKRFVAFLRGESSAAIFKRRGFGLANSEP
ncbi:molybdenum ABC transporter substrate-binding protein [Haloferula helveola]|uniref:Molybdenum ABC transporter substrate-binding protein n=1 Tax=Haloferula helveola TaxID=490095 RepID=A0ABM7RE37_9BACT|nr:molybdenum ABC transporter substrate-binding protein [Haloferula helveola]